MKLKVTLKTASLSAVPTECVKRSEPKVLYGGNYTKSIRKTTENFAELSAVLFHMPAEIINRGINRSSFFITATKSNRYYTAQCLFFHPLYRHHGLRDHHTYATGTRTPVNNGLPNCCTVRNGSVECLAILTDGYSNGIVLSKKGFNTADILYNSDFYGSFDSSEQYYSRKKPTLLENVGHNSPSRSNRGKNTGTVPIILKTQNTGGISKNSIGYFVKRKKAGTENADYTTRGEDIMSLGEETT